MPEISRFFCIVLQRSSAAPFSRRYGSQRAIIDIGTFAVLVGSLAPRVLGLVVEWAAQHQHELRANWDRARTTRH